MFALLAACTDPEPAALEDAAVDAATPDLDRGTTDGPPDAQRTDARPEDARVVDARSPDGQVLDPLDLGPVDAAPPDAARDAAARDAHLPDVSVDAVVDAGPPREVDCFNNLDDDNDGRFDCADPDCRRNGACFEHYEDCENGVDDNGNDRIDCEDVLCQDVCPPSPEGPLEVDEIQAIFDEFCNGCHGHDQDAVLDLRAPFTANTVGVPSSEVVGLRIAPGSREDSYLYRKLAFTYRRFPGGGGEGMPPWPEFPLPASTVDRIGQWIDGLAP